MDTKALSALAACVAVLAVVVGVLAVVIEFPTPVVVTLIAGAGLLLLSAGALIGVGIASQKKSAP